jgi:bifunctional enzyme CysN/CysC
VPKSSNISRVAHAISSTERNQLNGHLGAILWFTGLSGAGKSTLAILLERSLFKKGYQVFVLDGDNMRHGLSSDLSFAPKDRSENIRRVGEVAGLFAEAGIIVITAFISPYRADRAQVESRHRQFFSEIYINAPLEVCEKRDTKGLYRLARNGEISDFTGISAPYEAPLAPSLEVNTAEYSIEQCLELLVQFVEARFKISSSRALYSTLDVR